MREPMQGETLADVTNRLKTMRGHVDHIIELVERGGYAIDVMRQVAAARGALDARMRVSLRYYFEHPFVNAVKANRDRRADGGLAFLRQLD